MNNKNSLKLKHLAIGSLPHTSGDEAFAFVEKYFSEIPFWPQLSKASRKEDMIFQFLENMPGIVLDSDKVYLDGESDEFFEQIEQMFMDYETGENLDSYSITSDFSITFSKFIAYVKNTKPEFAKGQITGPFTLATSLCDKDDKCVFYDETLREVVLKTLILKALWQIKEIKKASPDTTPIIFIDEPSISQLGTSAYITVSKDEVVELIKEVSDKLHEAGALTAVHCCGKCDWSILTKAGVDMINLDAYQFAQSLSLFSEDVKQFLEKGGKIVWGVVPTLDRDALVEANLDIIEKKFNKAVEYLEEKGINKDLIVENSMVSTSCGAGSLTIELAEKALKLTKELSEKLRSK